MTKWYLLAIIVQADLKLKCYCCWLDVLIAFICLKDYYKGLSKSAPFSRKKYRVHRQNGIRTSRFCLCSLKRPSLLWQFLHYVNYHSNFADRIRSITLNQVPGTGMRLGPSVDTEL